MGVGGVDLDVGPFEGPGGLPGAADAFERLPLGADALVSVLDPLPGLGETQALGGRRQCRWYQDGEEQ